MPFVLGAAGFLGLNLVDHLTDLRCAPTCGYRGRPRPALTRRGVRGVRVCDDPSSLAEAFAGHDVVFHLAGHVPPTSLDPDCALATGLRELEGVLDAAVSAGVRRIVYVSSTATVAPASGASTEADVWREAPSFGTYHALKWHMERRALAEDRLDVVVACPSGCVGPYDLRLGTSLPLVALARGIDPPHPDGVVNLVDARDVADALVRLAVHPVPPRRVLLSAATWSAHDLLCQVADRYGVPQPGAALPPEEARAFADAEERAWRDTGRRPRLSREMVDLVVHGVAVDASFSARNLGLRWRPWEATLAAWEAWARRAGILVRRTGARPQRA